MTRSAIETGADQARTIATATFDGFLQSDLMPQGMQAPALIWAAAFLVGPALFFPVQWLAKYPYIRRYVPWQLERTFWDDRLLFLLMSAGAMGAVSVVLWDTLFPARRDAFVLTPLPVSLPVQMLGRLGGLLFLCVAFVLALNAIPSVTFPLVASGAFIEMPRAMVGHFVATASVDAFVFFSITTLQGAIILAVGRGAAAKLSPVAQTFAVVGILLTLLFIGGIRVATAGAILRGNPTDPLLAWNPAAWFLGLYEFIAGSPRPMMRGLAARALVAAMVPSAATLAIYAFGYKRLLKRAVETPSRSTRSILTTAVSRIVRLLFIRRPQEQAIAAFLLRGIARSGRHSLLMSIYTGVGMALMITFVLPAVLRTGAAAFSEPTVTMLALPLVLSAALACGVRILITIPAEMNARWVFQTASISPRVADAGAHKAVLLLVVPPVMATAAATAALLWNAHTAVLHAIYCGALALLLCEILLLSYRGIPLTRPYVPGGSRFHMLWAAYISAFLTYTLSSANLESTLLRANGVTGVLYASAVFVAIAAVVWARRKVRLRDLEQVTFEAEIPDDETFKGFNLSEIDAAQAVAGRRRL